MEKLNPVRRQFPCIINLSKITESKTITQVN